jgi:hypothetical protein
MDTNMEDVPRAPADISPVPIEPAPIPTLDGWIESLMACKQLAEGDVQRLCDKVRTINLGSIVYGKARSWLLVQSAATLSSWDVHVIPSSSVTV